MAESIQSGIGAGARPDAAWRFWPGWRALMPYFYVLPVLSILGLFVYWPILSSVLLSLTHWDFLMPEPRYVGLDNYKFLLTSDEFWNALWVTVAFTLVSVPVRLLLALGLAMALLRNRRLERVLRAAFFLPVVVSTVAISIIWGWMYNTEFGLLNGLLALFDLGPVPWLTRPDMAIVSVAIVDIWKQIGYDMVLYIAGLQAIPSELLEAARIDGARFFKRFRTIVLPLLMPTTFFLIVVSVINSFQVFTIVNVLTQGGPAGGTDVLVHMLYRISFINFAIGQGSALAVMLFVVLIALTVFKFAVIGRSVHYGYD